MRTLLYRTDIAIWLSISHSFYFLVHCQMWMNRRDTRNFFSPNYSICCRRIKCAFRSLDGIETNLSTNGNFTENHIDFNHFSFNRADFSPSLFVCVAREEKKTEMCVAERSKKQVRREKSLSLTRPPNVRIDYFRLQRFTLADSWQVIRIGSANSFECNRKQQIYFSNW